MATTFIGTTTNAFVEVTSADGGDDGLKYFGTVLNTGANGLGLRITVTDYLGNTDILTPTIAAGANQRFDTISFNFGPNTKPPWKTIKVEAQSSVNNSPTTYEFVACRF